MRKKKIGILSMQRVVNYGSFLQSYALKHFIEDMGFDTVFIDIRKGFQLNIGDYRTTDKSQNMLRVPVWKRFEHVAFLSVRNMFFQHVLFNKYGINSPGFATETDCVVIGSDEVFNCCQKSEWGVSTQLFGELEVPSFSYAASFGFTTHEMLKQYGIDTQISRAMQGLKGISVRDDNSRTCALKLLDNVRVEKHVDPVFLHNWESEIVKKNRFHDYILVYAYDNRITNKNEIEAIKNYARKMKKKLISFGVYQRWCDHNVMCSPFELLGYFAGADAVITDTFHGSVISIKLNKQFATIIRPTNKNKLMDLLCKFGLDDRIVSSPEALEDVFNTTIDYDPINTIIEAEKQRSKQYLTEMIIT